MKVAIVRAKTVTERDGSFAVKLTFTLHGEGQDGKELTGVLHLDHDDYNTLNAELYCDSQGSPDEQDDKTSKRMKQVFDHLVDKIGGDKWEFRCTCPEGCRNDSGSILLTNNL